MTLTSEEIRKRFLHFFEKRGHAILPSVSLVPENDPSALFTTAGVQPLVPYILQGSHPQGRRLASVQKCVRTTDIDEVGDKTHATFFEMLGNWSIGDYFKEDAIAWSYELLTNADEGFGLDPKRLYVTVYEGDDESPRDTESVEFWKKAGVPEDRIYFLGESNFWSAGENGPCGPSTEMFYDLTQEGLGDLTPEEFKKADNDQQVVEIWNDVFMEYRKENGRVVEKLPQKNVDTGSGLERLMAVLQNKESIFETDVFRDLMQAAGDLSQDPRAQRIIADHIRSATFLIGDGVLPSNTDAGYILRRLLRRAIVKTTAKNLSAEEVSDLVGAVTKVYKSSYPELTEKQGNIEQVIKDEAAKFEKTLQQGLKKLEKIEGDISGQDAFLLFATYGFPIEMTAELAQERGISIDREGFEKELLEHQEKSRTASAGKFRGGLGGGGEMEVKYHTATHLLNAALQRVLGEHVQQKGSNITEERLRFDFSHSEKLTDEQKQHVEKLINTWIQEDLPVTCKETTVEEAKAEGAQGVFESKYGDKVTVYSVGDGETVASKEICGGPHVNRTGELTGTFRIKKEESASAGVRRIKAVLE
ncbi:MAG: alanine--tRNA ligase [Candidatus Paceibacterota bacterium]